MISMKNIRMKKKINNPFEACRLILEILFACYSAMMFVVYPLYLENGYYMITDGKLRLYSRLHIAFFAVMAMVLLGYFALILKKSGIRSVFEMIEEKFLKREKCLFILVFSFVSSTLLAVDQHTAIHGFHDWYLGIWMYGSFLLLYLLYSLFFEFRIYSLHMLSLTASVMSILGYLQRFDINLVSDKGFRLGSGLVSTIGNINWVCDYIAVIMMVIIYLFFTSTKIWKIVYGVCLFFQYGFLAIQGSESGWIIIGMSLLLAFVINCLLRKKNLVQVVLLFLIAFFSINVTGMMFKSALESGKTAMYDSYNPIVFSKIWFVLSICMVILLVFLNFWKKEIVLMPWVGMGVFVSFVVLGIMLLTSMIMHSQYPSFLPFMKDYELLQFSKEWGHDRGGNWIVTLLSYKKSGIWYQIFGFGPDCFYFCLQNYGLSVTPWASGFINSGQDLTNAHNEFLTILINFGALGVVSYYGFFIYRIGLFIKERKKSEVCVWIAGALLLTFFHNLVSFQQIIATPFVFILLGIGMSNISKNTIDE